MAKPAGTTKPRLPKPLTDAQFKAFVIEMAALCPKTVGASPDKLRASDVTGELLFSRLVRAIDYAPSSKTLCRDPDRLKGLKDDELKELAIRTLIQQATLPMLEELKAQLFMHEAKLTERAAEPPDVVLSAPAELVDLANLQPAGRDMHLWGSW